MEGGGGGGKEKGKEREGKSRRGKKKKIWRTVKDVCVCVEGGGGEPTIKVSSSTEDTPISEVQPQVSGEVTLLTLPATV